VRDDRTQRPIAINQSLDPVYEYLSIDPVFSYYLDEGGLMSLYLGAFDNEVQAGIAAGTLQSGHTYYDLGIGEFKIYHNNRWIKRGEGGGVISEFCPNYTPVFVDADTFRVDGFHLGLLFSVGRRLRIIEGAVSKFGVINTVTENTGPDNTVVDVPMEGGEEITNQLTNNTVVDVTMEGGEEITNQLTNVCITPSVTNWVPIAVNPSSGNSIKAIRSGVYNAQNIVIAVGDLGLLMRSTDAGATFDVVASGTTKNLNDIAYDYTNEVFMVVGNDSTLLFSFDGGITWAPPAAFPSIQGDGLHYTSCSYGAGATGGFVLAARATTSINNHRAYLTVDHGASWLSESSSRPPTNIDYSPVEGYFLWPSGISAYTSNNPDFSWSATLTGLIAATCGCYLNNSLGAVAGGVNGEISRTVDPEGNNSWAKIVDSSFGLTDILGIDAADSSDLIHPMVVAVGRAGKIGYSMDAGATWTQAPNGFSPSDDINCVHFDAYNKVFLAGSANGIICRSTNGVT